MKLESVKNSYARWAPIYDTTFGAITQRARRTAVGALNDLPVRDVLEVGVGTGLALPLYAPDRRVTGIDFSAEMLAKAKARAARQRLDHVAALLRMDARALDFPDDSFDAVAAMHVISVVPEPRQVMAEIVRVLKPGGRLAMANHFAREKGVLATFERLSAPFADLLGWHSDFDMEVVTGTPGLRLVEARPMPPAGLMTFLMLEKG